MLSGVKDFIGKATRTIASPKTAAVLGVCVAFFQLCMALEDLRKSENSIGFRPSKRKSSR